MASFCPTNNEIYSLSDFEHASYDGGIVDLISPSAQRNPSTQKLSENACATIYIAIALNDVGEFIEHTKDEYCYFNGMYMSAIRKYLNAAANPSLNNAVVNSYQVVTTKLIGHLMDITTVVMYITTKIPDNAPLSSFNDMLKKSMSTLHSQLRVVTSSSASATSSGSTSATSTGAAVSNNTALYKEMEVYSRQKSAYVSNLLMLYSFLNITALGLLFYVYRA